MELILTEKNLISEKRSVNFAEIKLSDMNKLARFVARFTQKVTLLKGKRLKVLKDRFPIT